MSTVNTIASIEATQASQQTEIQAIQSAFDTLQTAVAGLLAKGPGVTQADLDGLASAQAKSQTIIDNFKADVNAAETLDFPQPPAITVSSGSPQTAAAGTVFPTAFVVLVNDAQGNPVPNIPVVFAAPTTGASGTFTGSAPTDTVQTSSSGLATATAFTANTTTGSYTVTASVAGATTPASFSLTNS